MPNFNSLVDHMNHGAGSESHTLVSDSGNASLLNVLELMATSARDKSVELVGIGLDQTVIEEHGYSDLFVTLSEDALRTLARVVSNMLGRMSVQPRLRNESRNHGSGFRPLYVLIKDFDTIMSDPLAREQANQILVLGRSLGVYVLAFTDASKNEAMMARIGSNFQSQFQSLLRDEPEDA